MMANATWVNPGPHKPHVLSAEALQELRLMELYPNAANLLMTVDAAHAEIDRLTRSLSEEVRSRQAWAPAITAALDAHGIVTDTGDISVCVDGIHALGDLRDTWAKKFHAQAPYAELVVGLLRDALSDILKHSQEYHHVTPKLLVADIQKALSEYQMDSSLGCCDDYMDCRKPEQNCPNRVTPPASEAQNLVQALGDAAMALDKAVDYIDDNVVRGEIRGAEIAASRLLTKRQWLDGPGKSPAVNSSEKT